MVTEMITLKLEDVFLRDIDAIVSDSGYQNRTEFIRNALREKIEEIRLNRAMISLSHLKGTSKRKTTEKDLEKIRKLAFNKLDKKTR
jgi:metal-responsive CopG/Arc/MetJ family transcriptional regulator